MKRKYNFTKLSTDTILHSTYYYMEVKFGFKKKKKVGNLLKVVQRL